MLGGEESDVSDATRLIPDARASHYWDEHGATITGYTATLSLPEPAWDIYMVYGPGARWTGARPPKPDFWMHQLGSEGHERVAGPYLDPEVFARRVMSAVAQSSLRNASRSATSVADRR